MKVGIKEWAHNCIIHFPFAALKPFHLSENLPVSFCTALFCFTITVITREFIRILQLSS